MEGFCTKWLSVNTPLIFDKLYTNPRATAPLVWILWNFCGSEFEKRFHLHLFLGWLISLKTTVRGIWAQSSERKTALGEFAFFGRSCWPKTDNNTPIYTTPSSKVIELWSLIRGQNKTLFIWMYVSAKNFSLLFKGTNVVLRIWFDRIVYKLLPCCWLCKKALAV